MQKGKVGWGERANGCYGGQERRVPERTANLIAPFSVRELGNHVRETVLLKIQNSRVFIKPASLKAVGGERAQRTTPSSQEESRKESP